MGSNSLEAIDFKILLRKLTLNPESFTSIDTRRAINEIINDRASQAQIGSFLTIKACVVTLCKFSLKINFESEPQGFQENLVDIVGTGGDGHNTFNVSSASAIVSAGAGAKVAKAKKHGNRSSTSLSGSSDFLTSLNLDIEKATPERVPEVLKNSYFCFLFAAVFHPAWKIVSSVRKELGFPTIFNYLGPLCNPVRPGRMVVGVYSKELGPLMAETLLLLGAVKGLVVHGDEGLDEISPEKETHAWLIENKTIKYLKISPEDFGLERHSLDSVKGGSSEENATTFRKILNNEDTDSPIRDFILINTAAVLFVSGIAQDFKQGVSLARESITSGRAKAQLETSIALLHSF
ncbi:anthranilate phosphoribosyltransferase [Entomophthora muscae]|uniref:Anthranilate phosphoribosyltransferase n=1 Tax=Entomophthora muscae TaxID=34485 RepID=A0ACC2TKZ4_9FUNG|nr:anthranilate phosphoribosyltransferase [Entomophthora muscae]